MPLISVIIPVYKVEQYIEECLDSLLNQTFIDFEIILIDDGSPDNSGIICDEYAKKDSRIRVVHKQNGGAGAARNTGIDAAHGEYIAFVDSDDFCNKNYLYNFFTDSQVNEDLVIQGFHKYVREEQPGIDFKPAIYDRNNLVGGILDNNLLSFGAPYCKLFRYDIIEKNNIRFSTKYSFGEDTYFFFSYLTHIRSIRMVNSKGYYYRCDHEGSLSMKNHDFNDLVAFANDSLKLLRIIDANNRLEVVYSKSYVGLYARALANMYRLGYNWNTRISCINQVKDKNISAPLLFTGSHPYKTTYLFARNMPSIIIDIALYINHMLKD